MLHATMFSLQISSPVLLRCMMRTEGILPVLERELTP